MEFQLKIFAKELFKEKKITLPVRATDGSAGYDVRACLEKPVKIYFHEVLKIPTGIGIWIQNPNIAAKLILRSSVSTNGLSMPEVGLIDSDYQGQIFIPIYNRLETPIIINPNDKIAQLVFVAIHTPELKIVDEFSDMTARGQGGFGSTGKM